MKVRWISVGLALAALGVAAPAAGFCRTSACELGEEERVNEGGKACMRDAHQCVTEGNRLHWGSPCLSYAVQRDGQWQALQADANGELQLRQGEVMRVDLDVDVPASMTYVAVDDPVPGGIEPLNPDLATTAGIDETALNEGTAYPWPFYHRELRFDAVRHYADYVGQGNYLLSWFGQAVAAAVRRL